MYTLCIAYYTMYIYRHLSAVHSWKTAETLVTTYKLIVKPWLSLANSYRKCWTSDISYIWEVLISMWKQSSWEIFFLSQGKRKAGGRFKEEGEKKKKKKKLSLCRVQGWNPRMTFQCEVLQTAKIHSNSGHNTESTSQHETSPSKGSHSLPLNILEGGERSDIAHDKQQTTLLLKYKYFDTNL